MHQYFERFRKDEDGAVTVDWIVLTAAIIGLAIALLLLIANSATDKSDGVGARVETQEISTYN